MTHSPNGWSPAGENVQAQDELETTSHDPLVEALEKIVALADKPEEEWRFGYAVGFDDCAAIARQALSAHRGLES